MPPPPAGKPPVETGHRLRPGLLGEKDPAPYKLMNAQGTANILLLGDHAGKAFPAVLGHLGLDAEHLDRHITFDIGSRSVISILSNRLNARAVMGNYSRLVVDLNRHLHDPTAFPEISENTVIPKNHHLSDAEKSQRIAAIYQPYHDAIDSQIKEFGSRGIIPAIISIHSFTPVLFEEKRECHIGILWDKDPRIAAPLISRLQEIPDIIVGDNEPYSGKHFADYTIDHHAEARGLPHIGIEIRQDLLTAEDGIQHWANILADHLGTILEDDNLFTCLDTGPDESLAQGMENREALQAIVKNLIKETGTGIDTG